MQEITLPKNIKYVPGEDNSGTFIIEGCYPGYGTTLGNALRRVILSSLTGAAITSVKIKGVSHEFSTVPGVAEDVVQIILNLKKVRLMLHKEEAIIKLSVSGKKEVNAGMIECPSDVEIVNPDAPVATLTSSKSSLEIEMEVSQGLGYVPVEQFDKQEKKIGAIDIDAIFTPIKRVNYVVENMRVGKRTDFDRLSLEISTDGTTSPEEAFKKSVDILINQFSSLVDLEKAEEDSVDEEETEEKSKAAKSKKEKEETQDEEAEVSPEDVRIADLKGLSNRTVNVFEQSGINTIGEILKMSEEELKGLKGMGDKGIKEVKKSIGVYGVTLKQ